MVMWKQNVKIAVLSAFLPFQRQKKTFSSADQVLSFKVSSDDAHTNSEVCVVGQREGFAELRGRGLVVTIPTSKTDWALSILWCGRLKNKLQN